MHESLLLLAEALVLTGQEQEALAEENEERLYELCERRTALLARAWEQREGCDTAALVTALQAIQQAQDKLNITAQVISDEMREALQQSREQSTRLSGYHKVVARQQSSLLLSTRG